MTALQDVSDDEFLAELERRRPIWRAAEAAREAERLASAVEVEGFVVELDSQFDGGTYGPFASEGDANVWAVRRQRQTADPDGDPNEFVKVRRRLDIDEVEDIEGMVR
jgi:hypothetical protein